MAADEGVQELVDQNAMDINAAVDYALDADKKATSYIKMELILSCEKIPKFGG